MPFWAEVVLRSVLTFAVMLLLTRMLGKRQITQLTYFEYITGITLGSLAAYAALEETIHWIYPLLAIAVWTLSSLAAEFLTLKSKKARDLIEGKGTVVIKDGKILEDNLKKERYTIDELLNQLRQKNAFRASDVEFAVLETTGNLSVLSISPSPLRDWALRCLIWQSRRPSLWMAKFWMNLLRPSV